MIDRKLLIFRLTESYSFFYLIANLVLTLRNNEIVNSCVKCHMSVFSGITLDASPL